MQPSHSRSSSRSGRHRSRTVRSIASPGSTPNINIHSMQMMRDIYKSIVDQPDIPMPPASPAVIRDIYDSSMFSHIPAEIRSKLELNPSPASQSVSFRLHPNRYIEIHAYSYDNISLPSPQAFVWMRKWLQYICSIANPQCTRTLKIYLLLNSAEKHMPSSDGAVLDAINANTAFTTACSSDNYICIYREEEWFKVFIHETFHSFGLDFAYSPDADKMNAHILRDFPGLHPSTDIRFYETYCEIWATLINIIISCNGSARAIRRAYKDQLLFSKFQANKLLTHYGLSYSELVGESREKSRSARSPKWIERTPVFSYYILKTILLTHCNEFLSWCKTMNEEHKWIQFDAQKIEAYYNELILPHKNAWSPAITQNEVNGCAKCKRKTMKMTIHIPRDIS